MVLFANINLNQRVEILRAGKVHRGTVRYKGCVNGEPGEWVGVALDNPVGLHDGMIHGRRYFLCRDKHGIFTTASQIRFIPLKRCLYNTYHTVVPASETEEDLFGDVTAAYPRKCDIDTVSRDVYIDSDYKDGIFNDHRGERDHPLKRPYFPLNHPISSRIPSAVMLNPALEKSKCFGDRAPQVTTTRRYKVGISSRDFITSPTIPKVHMPHTAQKHQAGRGWKDAHYTREITVNTARDSIKYDQWNDISA